MTSTSKTFREFCRAHFSTPDDPYLQSFDFSYGLHSFGFTVERIVLNLTRMSWPGNSRSCLEIHALALNSANGRQTPSIKVSIRSQSTKIVAANVTQCHDQPFGFSAGMKAVGTLRPEFSRWLPRLDRSHRIPCPYLSLCSFGYPWQLHMNRY